MPRKRIFVDSAVQGALIRNVVTHWLVFLVTLAVILGAVQFFQNPVATADEQLAQFPRRHGLTFVILLLLLPTFLWDTVRLSNRFAGPVLRLRRMMQQLAEGKDPGELRFREGDFWSELGDHFNGIREQILDARQSQESSVTAQPYEFTAAAKTAE
jgi:nitrogen fixation/metabolism regulation signal transduction histidine kinase